MTPRAESVRISAGETTELTLQLRRGGWIQYKAVDGEGKDVGGFARLYDSSGHELSKDLLFAGRRSGVLPSGNVRVVGTSNTGKNAEVSAKVEAGETAEVVLTFSD